MYPPPNPKPAAISRGHALKRSLEGAERRIAHALGFPATGSLQTWWDCLAALARSECGRGDRPAIGVALIVTRTSDDDFNAGPIDAFCPLDRPFAGTFTVSPAVVC
jgi:hypothetical protein